MPAPPTPVIARPTIRVMLFWATPETSVSDGSQNQARESVCYSPLVKLPISKRKTEVKNDGFREKYLYTFPHDVWKAATVKKKADPYHPTWSRLLNSSVIRGMAVATIVCCSLDIFLCSKRGFQRLDHQIKSNLKNVLSVDAC